MTEREVTPTHDFAGITKRKPQSVSFDRARWAIVGRYRDIGGVLCWTTNLTEAEAGAAWYRKRGGSVQVISSEDVRRNDTARA